MITARARTGPAATGLPVLLVIGVVGIAVNLRPAVASVGPVLDDLRRDRHLSALAVAVLTSTPVVCFGALAPIAPRLARRVGLRAALALLLVAIAAGLLLRLGPGLVALFAGTVLAAGGIAAANVLVPALVKKDFPGRTGLAMGIYTTALTAAAALAAGLTVPLTRAVGGGERTALGMWALPAVVGLALWAPQVRRSRTEVPDAPAAVGSLRRDRVAWAVTGYFGMQSLSFYAVLAWLPSLYRDAGYSAAAAGGLLSLSAAIQAPVSLVVPTLATRVRDQRALVVAAALCAGIGLVGVLAAPTSAPLLWVTMLGIGQGAAFPLGLTLVVLRTSSSDVTARLSAMSQTVGYLVAALGPLTFGLLHARSGSWSPSVTLLLVLLVPQTLFGVAAARNRLAVPAAS